MENAYQKYRTTFFFPSLEGVRCISILLVLWHHYAPMEIPLPMFHRGFLGVDMFFVLSGFLITTLLLREKESFGTISIRRFFMRRTLRIFPVYYILLLALSAYFFIRTSDPTSKEWFRSLPFLATYTSNWVHDVAILGVAWSLAAEEQFYLVWPWIEKFFGRLIVPFVILLIIVNQLVNFSVLPFVDLSSGSYLRGLEIVQITFTPICLGVLMAHFLHNESNYLRTHHLLKSSKVQWLITLLTLVCMNIPVADISGFTRLSIQLCFSAVIAIGVTAPDHEFKLLFENRISRYLGSISYGIYLYHMITIAILHKIFAHSIDGWRFFILYVGITIGISHLSFHYLEMPFLKIKKRFSTPPSPAVRVKSQAK